jgi:hypothetical protein
LLIKLLTLEHALSRRSIDLAGDLIIDTALPRGLRQQQTGADGEHDETNDPTDRASPRSIGPRLCNGLVAILDLADEIGGTNGVVGVKLFEVDIAEITSPMFCFEIGQGGEEEVSLFLEFDQPVGAESAPLIHDASVSIPAGAFAAC